jgi:flagellar biosynthetic protein FliR
MLSQILPETLFAYLLVLARVGAALMVMPGFGEVFLPARIRLMIAFGVSAVLFSLVQSALPAMPGSPLVLVGLIGGEVAVGLFLGFLAQMMLMAMHTAGMIVAFQVGFGNVMAFDPTIAQQGSITGVFLGLLALLLIFATDSHHLMLQAVVRSYTVFVPGEIIPAGEISQVLARALSRSFSLAVQISAPFLVAGLLFYVGIGLLARLMPQIQVFFIALPLQIVLGLAVLMLVVSAMSLAFLDAFRDTFQAGLMGG